MLEKISKLLLLAERAATQEEAQAALAKAQRLATEYAIDLAVARAHAAEGEKREEVTSAMITLSQPRQQGKNSLVMLLNAIARGNSVHLAVYGSTGRVELWGFPSDIALVREMYSALSVAMVRLCEEYLSTDEWRGRSMRRKKDGRLVQLTRQSARTSFYEGFYRQIENRVQDERAEALREAAERESAPVAAAPGDARPLPVSTALVMRDKEIEVSEVYKTKSGARGSWRGSLGGGTSDHARAAGARAANRASLTGQRAIGA